MTRPADPNDLSAAVRDAGLAWRGAFHPLPADQVPLMSNGAPIGTMILAGFAGSIGWPTFASSAEARDGQPNPLDRWSRRVISDLSATFGAMPLFPFDGPPWHPFQRWAQRAESVHPSPLGSLIHPQWGLWHSYRGALAFAEILQIASVVSAPSPCSQCAAKPCLSACPVGAFSDRGFEASKCHEHLSHPAGSDCMALGCRARAACPVGAQHRYSAEQAAFHMAAFHEPNTQTAKRGWLPMLAMILSK